MEWYNEPPTWHAQDGIIEVTTAPGTDFWRKTHYGFVRDNGHFYYRTVSGDFTATVTVRGAYTALYDQAGLMVRLDETTWLKCGVEYVEGVQQASAVVTRDYSDWSVAPLPDNPAGLWLRLRRRAEAIEIEYGRDGLRFTLLRIAYLTPATTLQVGVMAASPEGPGFPVAFDAFTIDHP